MKFSKEIEDLVNLLAQLPSLGPRSARRIVFHLLTKKLSLAERLVTTLDTAVGEVVICSCCGNIDTVDPCQICSDPERDAGRICVVEQVADLWAMERAGVFQGVYHVLGGNLSVIDRVGPEQLRIKQLLARVHSSEQVKEVILALNFTMEGKVTRYYLLDQLRDQGIQVTELAHGIPVGGELDYLDNDTLAAAVSARKDIEE